jgi:hypothetical protein
VIVQADDELEDWSLVDRIIALRAEGHSFAEIGVRLESEGFDARNPGAWPVQILRRLAQRKGD